MKKLKSKNGITLIALIITIIILLILAMVTINILINQGIIGHANNAVRGYEVAEEKELISLAYQHYKMDQQNPGTEAQLIVDGANGGNPIAKEDGTWYITFDKTKHNYELSENGTVETAGERWTKSGDGAIKKGEVTVNIGDYINYDCLQDVQDSNLLTYIAPKELTGYSEDQTFSVTQNPRWQILGKDDKGRMLITTENPVTSEAVSVNKIYLMDKAGYVNGPDQMNKLAAIYGHGKHAADTIYEYDYNGTKSTSAGRSMKAEDINKALNYTPEKLAEIEHTYANPGEYTYEKPGADDYIMTNGKEGTRFKRFNYYDEATKEWKTLQPGEKVTYSNTASSYSMYSRTMVTAIYNMLYAGNSSDNWYYLADKVYLCYNDGLLYFNLRMVSSSSVDYHNFMYSSSGGYENGNNKPRKAPIRPVVVLKSDTTLGDKVDGVWQIK